MAGTEPDGEGPVCGGYLGDLSHGPVDAVLAALRHVEAETGTRARFSSLDVALLTDSLITQGAFTGPLTPPGGGHRV